MITKNINSTLRKIVKLGEKKYYLNIFGTGVEAPENIKNFRLTFRTQKKYNLDEARKLIIDFTEDKPARYVFLGKLANSITM